MTFFQKVKAFAMALVATFAIGLCIQFLTENINSINDLNILESIAVYHLGILLYAFLSTLFNSNTESQEN